MEFGWGTGRTIALAGLALALGACGTSKQAEAPVPPPAAPASTTVPISPATLLAAATADANQQQWVHVAVSDRRGSDTASITQDSGPGQGQQTIQVGAVSARVVMVGGLAYIEGNSQAITSYFGMPAADGPTLAGRWISLSPSDSGYPTVTAGVSLTSVLQEVGLTGQLSQTAPTTRDGQAVVGISGTAGSPDSGGGAATLYVTTTDHPLPVEFDTSSAQGSETAVFSGWGTPVSLSAPSGALPIASIPS